MVWSGYVGPLSGLTEYREVYRQMASVRCNADKAIRAPPAIVQQDDRAARLGGFKRDCHPNRDVH